MEGKAMRVVQKIMPLFMIALVVGQPNIPTPNTPTIPGVALAPPAIPGGGQLPPGAGVVPPGGGMLPPGGGILPPGGGILPPGGGQLPPGGGMLPPGGGILPPGGGLFPPTMPWDGMVPPLIPGGDGSIMIPPFIPGIGSIDLPKRKCAGKCSLQCQKSKRNRFAAKICTGLCLIRCGIRKSNVVDDCTTNCAHSVSLDSISDASDAQSLVDSCFERCKNN